MTALRLVLAASDLFPDLAHYQPFFWLERWDSAAGRIIWIGGSYIEARIAAVEEDGLELLDLVANFVGEVGTA